MSRKMIICVPWKDKVPGYPGARRRCCQCLEDVSIDPLNVGRLEVMQAELWCTPCAAAELLATADPVEFTGFMVGGKLFEDENQWLRAILARMGTSN